MNPITMKRISQWGKFTGILTMIWGALTAVSGLPLLLIGAIPGLLITWFGYIVYKTAENASKYQHDNKEEHIEDILDSYGKLLKFFGIYTIVSIVLMLVTIIAFFGLIMSGIAGLNL